MSQPAADRNLLFGIMAVQMDFISRDALISAMSAWVLDKKAPLGQVLLKQKAIAADSHALLDALVQKHLAMHGNDAEKSLAAISSATSVRQDLEKIADHDVQASLIHVAGPPRGKPEGKPPVHHDPYATVNPSVGTSTSAGLRFRVLRPHAKGGLGAVFVAQDEELQREVALKEIQDRHADDLDCRSRFLLEAEITGGLEHPGIVPVYGLGTYADGRPYYAMRFIRGDSLKEAVDRFHKNEDMGPGQRTLEIRNLLGRFVDVCNAIAYAHSRGILHRDLKPGNIMLGKYGETLVVDWGLAKPIDSPEALEKTEMNETGEGSLQPKSLSASSQTMMGSAVGTPQYMSPEQAAGRLNELGPASDVYSLGATLYCLLTGKSPINETDVGAVLQKVQKGDFPRPRQISSSISPPLEAICLKAMALNPNNRYASPRALANDIEHWLADEPVAAWPEPWTVKARRWVSRHRTLVTSVVSVVAVAVLGLSTATVLLTAANERERLARKDADDQKVEAVKQKGKAEENEVEAKRQKGIAETNEADAKRQKGIAEINEAEAKRQTGIAERNEAEARRQEKIATEAEAETKRQKVKVEENFKLARSAVDDYHTLVSEDVLLDQPGLEKLRHDLLAKAGAYYDKFTKEHVNDLTVRADYARALYRLARVTGDIGSQFEAVKLLEKTVPLFESLLKEQANPELESELASSFHHLGRLNRKLDQFAKSGEAYNKALKIWEGLVVRNPKVDAYQAGLAETQLGLGNWQLAAGDVKAANALYDRSLAIWKTLAQAHEKVTKYRRYESQAYNNTAQIFKGLAGPAKTPAQLEKAKESQQAYLKAEAILKTLSDDNRSIPLFKSDLARTKLGLGELYVQTRLAAPDAALQEAVKIYNYLIDRYQDHTEYRVLLADCFSSISRTYRAAAVPDLDKAEDMGKNALEIRKKLAKELADVPDHQIFLARDYRALGDVYRAQKNQAGKAEAAYNDGLQVLEKLAKSLKQPLRLQRAEFGRIHNSLGLLFNKEKQQEKAMAALSTSLSEWEKLLKDYPQDQEFAGELNTTCVNLGIVSRSAKKLKEAVDAYTRGVQALETKDDKTGKPRFIALLPDLHAKRADILTEQAKDAEALRDWDRIVELNPSGASSYRLAQSCALTAAAVAKDDARKEQAEQYALRAMKLLTAARKVDFFKTPANLQKLRTDMELQFLRDREDFKKFSSEVGPNP